MTSRRTAETAESQGQTFDQHLELVGIRKMFHGVEVLKGIDIAAREGEFLAILGPSGSGKSTLLNIIGGFEQPSAGSVRLQGRDITAEPPYRRNVNTVFQSYALFTHMSVLDNITYGLRRKKVPIDEAQRRARHMLELVGLPDFGGRSPSTLSGGEQQRIALARALVNEPAVLLLDEPLSALDVKIRRHMQSELKRIHRETHSTFVHVTHDQEEALSLADRIAVMSRGRCEQIGTAWDIYMRPATRFVADFVGDMNWFEGRLGRADGAAELEMKEGAALILPEPPGAAAVGEEVLIGVRPEHMQIFATSAAVPPRQPVVPARIVDTTFQGSILLLKLKTEFGLGIEVKQQIENAHMPAPHADGQVYVSWEGASQVVFAKEAQT